MASWIMIRLEVAILAMNGWRDAYPPVEIIQLLDAHYHPPIRAAYITADDLQSIDLAIIEIGATVRQRVQNRLEAVVEIPGPTSRSMGRDRHSESATQSGEPAELLATLPSGDGAVIASLGRQQGPALEVAPVMVNRGRPIQDEHQRRVHAHTTMAR